MAVPLSMATIFLTGFPGFLASELLPRLLRPSPEKRAVCLVQAKFADPARERVRALEAAEPVLAGRIELALGDITKPRLGLTDADRTARDVAEIHHLAAIYDLSVAPELARRVNVVGTKNVLDFAERASGLQRLHHVSTCYVSGRYAGVFRETDLDKRQRFQNAYEETKFLAEVEVQRRMREGLPATIYRPAIVVGDSRSGATQKLDGPYFVMRWILRQVGFAVVPLPGDPTATRVNIVPRDFVVDAIAHLASLTGSRGQVYQLADPEPLTVDELLDVLGNATGRRIVRVPMPGGLAKLAIDRVPLVERVMQIPSSAVDYFTHPTHYTCDHALRDLAGSGIRVPPFASYVDRLVAFARSHPELGSAAMA